MLPHPEPLRMHPPFVVSRRRGTYGNLVPRGVQRGRSSRLRERRCLSGRYQRSVVRHLPTRRHRLAYPQVHVLRLPRPQHQIRHPILSRHLRLLPVDAGDARWLPLPLLPYRVLPSASGCTPLARHLRVGLLN